MIQETRLMTREALCQIWGALLPTKEAPLTHTGSTLVDIRRPWLAIDVWCVQETLGLGPI